MKILNGMSNLQKKTLRFFYQQVLTNCEKRCYDEIFFPQINVLLNNPYKSNHIF